jgi:hypothetical protein
MQVFKALRQFTRLRESPCIHLTLLGRICCIICLGRIDCFSPVYGKSHFVKLDLNACETDPCSEALFHIVIFP